MSDTQKKPAAGEWWFSADMKRRLYVIGSDPNGGLRFWCLDELQVDVEEYMLEEFDSWHHEPACTGVDWQPETFPQWRAASHPNNAYIRLEADSYTVVAKNGSERKPYKHDGPNGAWFTIFGKPRITREQAEALVRKPDPVCKREVFAGAGSPSPRECGICGEGPCGKSFHKCLTCDAVVPGDGEACADCYRYALESVGAPIGPAESPNDLVMLPPEHVIRNHIDRFAYPDSEKFVPVNFADGIVTVGYYSGNKIFKCRREDLPPLPEPSKQPDTIKSLCTDLGQLRDDFNARCEDIGKRLEALENRAEVPL